MSCGLTWGLILWFTLFNIPGQHSHFSTLAIQLNAMSESRLQVSTTTDLPQRARNTLDLVRRELLAERNGDGHWEGELSSSALSTATAVSALSAVLIHRHAETDDLPTIRGAVQAGMDYLSQQQNDDGGFGDTDRSHSNIATSYLAWAASSLADQSIGKSLSRDQRERLQRYVESKGELDGLRERYGTDKTFVVPIMTNMAIAGLVPWSNVPALPFEAAVFPQAMYRLLSMPVVSYAIPALVAIGQARHFLGPKAWIPMRWLRAASVAPTLKVLGRMQPESGGYLEATPLTSFVVMSLAVTDRVEHEVTRSGVRFLLNSIRGDGSWPIDTNLATWVTSLSIGALTSDPDDEGEWCSESLVRWHRNCQHRQRHPFTGAEPGGWGWSDLSGAVPDSDDTPAAILAIKKMERFVSADDRAEGQVAIEHGCRWLGNLQNRDGGWPTFCRGWGKLPFDRSSNDLTAHALRALAACQQDIGASRIEKAEKFLRDRQQPDGSWFPLWFGNQDREDETNPVYGTSRVLLAGACGFLDDGRVDLGCRYLMQNQNADGGWGGGHSVRGGEPGGQLNGQSYAGNEVVFSSVEESALAIEALCAIAVARQVESARYQTGPGGVQSSSNSEIAGKDRILGWQTTQNEPKSPQVGKSPTGGKTTIDQSIIRGVEFLIKCVEQERHREPWPIGFYFAKLWYHERLYPTIFTVAALGKYLQWTAGLDTGSEPSASNLDSRTSDA